MVSTNSLVSDNTTATFLRFAPEAEKTLFILILETLKFSFKKIYWICPTLGLFTNSINLVVILRQGLHDSVTLSLFTLSVSDLILCIVDYSFVIAIIVEFFRIATTLHPNVTIALTYPRMTVYTFSSIITLYLALERSLCVVLPFRFKIMFTTKKTLIIMVVVAFSVIALFIPSYLTTGLVWRYDPTFNMTRLMFVPKSNRGFMVSVVVFSNLAIPLCAEVTIGVSSIFMVYGLRQSNRFKKQCTDSRNADSSREGGLSGKEIRLAKLVMTLSIIFCICNFPMVTSGIAQLIEPEFALRGHYYLMFEVVYYTVYLMAGLNASVNFFVYYRFNTRFKQTFLQIVHKFCLKTSHDHRVDQVNCAPCT